MSIRRRITVAAAIAVAVAVLVMMVGAFFAVRRQLLVPIDASLEQRAEAIARIPTGDLRENGSRPSRNVFVPGRPGEFDVVYYQIVLPSGTVVNVGDDGLVLPSPSDRDLDDRGTTLRSAWVGDVHLRIATVYQPQSGVYVQLGRSLTEADQTLRRLAGLLVVGGAVGIAVAIGLGILVSRSAVGPIDDLRVAVSGITESDALGTRLDVVGDDEVAQLATAFNGLLSQLQRSKEQQVRLVRDAGHELRTPLTALRMNLEILQRHEVPAEERTAMLNAAHAEVEELSDLVAEVVDLATDRYEEEPFTDVDLAEVCMVVVDRLHRRNGRHVTSVVEPSVVRGKRDALDRAITNVIANADTWAPDAGTIELIVAGGTVTVRDTGPGFADDDLPHVFERFYRSDLARAKPGSGLGLSIVDQIVMDHGGTVFARNRSDGRGAVVGFTIPAA